MANQNETEIAEAATDENTSAIESATNVVPATATTRQVTALKPRVVIVGAGFGGLQAALALRRALVEVTVIDRRNHHLFQPLLYQVATAGLSPADISAPVRGILRKQANTRVILAEVSGIDVENQRVIMQDSSIPYDYLIIATGARHSYFGHNEWEPFAMIR